MVGATEGGGGEIMKRGGAPGFPRQFSFSDLQAAFRDARGSRAMRDCADIAAVPFGFDL